MTKQERQNQILSLIRDHAIATQAELTKFLVDAGIDVTQATISRDLQELRIVKILMPDGNYRYAAAESAGRDDGRLESIMHQCLLHVDFACNIVVLKTLTGAAQAVGYALDSLPLDEMVGSIAGDDTLMVVVRSEAAAGQLAARLKEYIQ